MTVRNFFAVYTAHGLRDFEVFGGTARWKAVPQNVGKCKYVVCVKKAGVMQGGFGNPDVAPGTAFLIGRITDVKEVAVGDSLFYMGDDYETPGRYLIKFDSYADISIPDFWTKSQKPFAYRPEKQLLDMLSVSDLEMLDFKPLRNASEEDVASYADRLQTGRPRGRNIAVPNTQRGLTISEARLGLAQQFGVAEENIEITIRA